MTVIISTLALLTSMMLLIVHYKNQIERRHGEITQLRSDFLRRIAAAHQRLISYQLLLETMRIKLRHITDEDGKYEAIEKMPSLIEKTREVVQGLSEIKDRLEGIDTIKLNRSKILLMLQSIENNVRSVEEKASRMEQELLTALEDIRIKQERGKK